MMVISMRIFKFIKEIGERKRREKEELENKRVEEENKKIQEENRNKLIQKFYLNLRAYNLYRCSPDVPNIYGCILYKLFDKMDNIGKEKIELEKGTPFILLIKKQYEEFKAAETADSTKNNLEINSRELQLISILDNKEGVLFKDNNNNLYCGKFLGLYSPKYNNGEFLEAMSDYQKYTLCFYVDHEFNNDVVVYYNDLDILLIVDDSRTGEMVNYCYAIEYNISKKVILFDKKARKNQCKKTMLKLYKNGFRFELSEAENKYIEEHIKKENK